MDLYFERHDGQAVTTDDFLAAMTDANAVDLSQFARWYAVAGTPRVRARGHYDAEHQTYALELRQIHGDSPGQPAATKPMLLIPVTISLLDANGQALGLMLKGEAPSTTAVERTLWLRDTDEQFVFTHINTPPVPSLLRGFSAPVKLEFDYSDQELAFLVRHDSDAFCRWDSLQTLITRAIERGVPDPGSIRELSAVFAELIDQPDADPALVAEMLTLPSEASLALAYDAIDVEALHTARERLRTVLAATLEARLVAAWERTRSTEPYRYDPALSGRRHLHGAALDLLSVLHAPAHLARAKTQFDSADNMTDRLAALRSLSAYDSPEAHAASQRFRTDYDAYPLVLDKWFTLHATRDGEDTLERVQQLMADPAFTLKNPNRVRALIGAFAHYNHAGFHRADGAGYRFIAEQVLALDAFNPQVAARLVKCFARWRRYDSSRQEQIRTELKRMAATESLSTDVYEIVQRALA
jgi:aminopeptidase N